MCQLAKPLIPNRLSPSLPPSPFSFLLNEKGLITANSILIDKLEEMGAKHLIRPPAPLLLWLSVTNIHPSLWVPRACSSGACELPSHGSLFRISLAKREISQVT